MVPSEAGNPIDAVTDLDLTTADLARREEMLRREYERNARLIAVSTEQADDTVGSASTEDGAVRIVVDANQRVIGVALDPRALRLGSIGRWSARSSTPASRRRTTSPARSGGPRPIRCSSSSTPMPELTQLLPPSAYAAYLTPDEPVADAEPARPAAATRSAERSIYE